MKSYFLPKTASTELKNVLEAFEGNGATVSGGPTNFSTICPCHDDTSPSLSISDGDHGVRLNCHAGCEQMEMFGAVVEFTGLKKSDFFYDKKTQANGEGSVVTIAELAAVKCLPPDYFLAAGMRDSPEGIRVPYWDGATVPWERIRSSLKARDGSYWGRRPFPNYKMTAYGAWRLPEIRGCGFVIFVEGETDTITGWHHQLPVLGIPGKRAARRVLEHNAHLVQGIYRIFVIEEPDDYAKREFLTGVRRGLSDLHFHIPVFPMRLPEKDLSDLHVKRGESGFREAFKAAWDTAVDAPNWQDPLPVPPSTATVCSIIRAPDFPDVFSVRDVHRRDRNLSSAKIRADLEQLGLAQVVRPLPPLRTGGRVALRYRRNPKLVLTS